MPLTEQLTVRISGLVTREILDRLRLRLQLQRAGRLGDPEDIQFGYRYLRRTAADRNELTLLREDDTHWRLELNHLHQPLPAETVTGLRAEILAAVADAGLRVDEVWQADGTGAGDG